MQTKLFHGEEAVSNMNKFIKDKEVIDIKMTCVMSGRGSIFTQYLVLYKA